MCSRLIFLGLEHNSSTAQLSPLLVGLGPGEGCGGRRRVRARQPARLKRAQGARDKTQRDVVGAGGASFTLALKAPPGLQVLILTRISSAFNLNLAAPPTMWDKGTALSFLLGQLHLDARGFDTARDVFSLYLGDDATDEDAFHELKQQKGEEGGCGILVSRKAKPTYAAYTLVGWCSASSLDPGFESTTTTTRFSKFDCDKGT